MTYLNSLFDLTGNVALVTGGGSGIGKTFALALAKSGCNVVVADINKEAAVRVVKEVTDHGREGLAVIVDVSSPADIAHMSQEVSKKFGKVDILINNAGINITAPAEEFKLSDWNLVVSINLSGVLMCSQAIGKMMIERKRGKIINIASMYGIVGSKFHGAVAYNSTKAGVINLTRSLAVEWAKHNINVNAIAPGMIETELTKKRLVQQDYCNNILNRTPLGRLGQPDDLVGAMIYLASPASDWVTGHTIVVDGGYLAC